MRTLAALATGLAVCAGGALVAAGRGVSPVVLDLADGGAWLASSADGTLIHLNGPSGRADAAVTVPDAAGHRLTVADDGSRLLVADRDTGQVHRVEPARLAAVQSADLAPGVLVTLAAGQAYAVDGASGLVRLLDPADLSTPGRTVELPPGLGRPAQSSDGTLWVPVPADGTVVPVRSGEPGSPAKVAPAGHRLDALVMNDHPVVVDSTAETVIPLGEDGPEQAIPLPSGPERSIRLPGELTDGIRSSARVDGPLLPLVRPETRQLLLADVEAGQVTVVDLPRSGDAEPDTGLDAESTPAGPGEEPAEPAEPASGSDRWDGSEGLTGLGEPVPHAGHVYIPDSPAGTVLDFDLGADRFADPISVAPPGSRARIAVMVKDDQVWINDTAGVNAVVIGPHGQVPIPKQAVGLPGVPGQDARPLPPPPPLPSSSPTGPPPTDRVPLADSSPDSPDRGTRTGQTPDRPPVTTRPPDQVEPSPPLPPVSPTPGETAPPPVVPPPTSPPPVPTTRPSPTTARPEPTARPSQDDQVSDAGSRGRRVGA